MEKASGIVGTVLAIGLPTLAVLVGILVNKYDTGRIDARINRLEDTLEKRFEKIDTQFKELNEKLAELRDDLRKFMWGTTKASGQ